mmetsp:Transcript_34343/g.93004  ORF Transcript_34343/g.93004 Transcript_34343/m.93004 type:complete len:386 (-) Transcript_34343:292-1449(-)
MGVRDTGSSGGNGDTGGSTLDGECAVRRVDGNVVCTRAQQQLKAALMPLGFGEPHRRRPRTAPQVGLGARLQEQPQALFVPPLRSHMRRPVAVVQGAVGVAARVEQHPQAGSAVPLSSDVRLCGTDGATLIQATLGLLQEPPQALGVVPPGADVHGAAAEAVAHGRVHYVVALAGGGRRPVLVFSVAASKEVKNLPPITLVASLRKSDVHLCTGFRDLKGENPHGRLTKLFCATRPRVLQERRARLDSHAADGLDALGNGCAEVVPLTLRADGGDVGLQDAPDPPHRRDRRVQKKNRAIATLVLDSSHERRVQDAAAQLTRYVMLIVGKSAHPVRRALWQAMAARMPRQQGHRVLEARPPPVAHEPGRRLRPSFGDQLHEAAAEG